MKKILLSLAIATLGCVASAQVWQSEETVPQGGVINQTLFGDILTLNTVLTSSAQETMLIGLFDGPGLVFRDWPGNRSFRDEEGNFRGYFAREIVEEVPDQQFLVTLHEGWRWSDGVEMTADDVIAAFEIISDPAVGSNAFNCAYVDEDPVTWERVGDYQVRITLPRPFVNSLAVKNCGTVPAHIFMPVYEEGGAEAFQALWGVDTPVSEIVSGGPYILTEFRQGELLAFERNPHFGEFNVDAAGNPLPGPDRWVTTIVEDSNAQLARTLTAQADYFYPVNLDQVRAIQQAVQSGQLPGTFLPNIGPDTLVDYVTFNFNNTDECKANMFRQRAFRQAFSMLVDRQAAIEVALGGLGFPGNDYNSAASAPFYPDHLPPLEFDPEGAVRLLRQIGFTETGSDGVLRNPNTGCRVEFDLTYNAGNNRRGQTAQVIAQTAAEYGVRINAREVDSGTWGGSITGTELPRAVDYDANIWGLAGGDIDNPSGPNVLALAANLNAWNKSRTQVEPWEILIDRLTMRMGETLDLDERIAVYMERAQLMRDYMPMVPLISPAFHFYHNLENTWNPEAMDAISIQSPYRPGNTPGLLGAPQGQ